MLENVECLGHSTIKFKINNKIIYIDPYNIKEEYKDADLIFITHNHYDHFSKEDIKRIQEKFGNIDYKGVDKIKVEETFNYLENEYNISSIFIYKIKRIINIVFIHIRNNRTIIVWILSCSLNLSCRI